MKKLLLSLVVGVMTVCSMSAASITEPRIYINPGHGSWTGNDRNMPTINHATGDTTGFYICRKLESYDVKLSFIARGISVGDELEYADEITLGRSIVNRTPYIKNNEM